MTQKYWLVASVLLGTALLAQQVQAAASISTRVKVVEEKVRAHDKKIRELSARQELADKQLLALKQEQAKAAEELARKQAEAQQKAAAARAAARRAEQAKAEEAAESSSRDGGLSGMTSVASSGGDRRYAFP